MYNIGLKVTIGTTYEGIVIKIKADTIASAISKIATAFGVQTSGVTVDAIAYVQEILTNSSSNED